MIKKNLKKIVVSLIALLLVVGVAYTTYATGGESSIMDDINNMLQNETGNISNNENKEEILEGANNTNLNTNTNTNTKTTTSVKENRPATTPHAGVGDYTGLIFIVVFAVSAVYAYKKIRDYNA